MCFLLKRTLTSRAQMFGQVIVPTSGSHRVTVRIRGIQSTQNIVPGFLGNSSMCGTAGGITSTASLIDRVASPKSQIGSRFLH